MERLFQRQQEMDGHMNEKQLPCSQVKLSLVLNCSPLQPQQCLKFLENQKGVFQNSRLYTDHHFSLDW